MTDAAKDMPWLGPALAVTFIVLAVWIAYLIWIANRPRK